MIFLATKCFQCIWDHNFGFITAFNKLMLYFTALAAALAVLTFLR